ncbi:hypothetical protein N0V82_002391 [Gnomoniopsis sp. IMI 355080]|nr:hypothetical protein N0V82_002391 [Gnomoniopsis sp. IMI 355080]
MTIVSGTDTSTDAKNWNGQTLDPIPGPKPLPIVGNALILDINDLVGSILKIAHQYRPIFSLTLLGKRELFVSSPSLVREICDERRFHKLVAKGLDKLRPVTGDGLFTAYHDNHEWGLAHRILLPLFGPLRIREDMLDDMVDIAGQLCLKWARMSSCGGSGWTRLDDLPADLTRLTLDTVALTHMSHRFNSFYLLDSLHPFVQHVDLVLAEAATRATLPDHWIVTHLLRRRSTRQFAASTSHLKSECQAMIDARRALGPPPASRSDVLGAMIFGRDPKTGEMLRDETIVENMLTFLSAGHETTSATLTLACYYLCSHPSALEKARQEVDALCGSPNQGMKHITTAFPYLDAVLRETMRLSPAAPAFFVVPYQDEILGGKYLVRAGESVCVALEVLQRDKTVYGADADEFRPERWMRDGRLLDDFDEFAWKPFGNGLRGCIGRSFVWQESLVFLAMVLRSFDMRMDDPSYKLKMRSDLSVKPDGFVMQVRLREGLTATEVGKGLIRGYSSISESESKKPEFALQKGPQIGGQPITILYGSNGGTCEALAHQLAATSVARGFIPKLVDTMDSAVEHLPGGDKGPVVMIVASYNGLPADNTEEMVKWLQESASQSLADVRYAVLGCGHRDWKETFQKVPRMVDELLAEAGAVRVGVLGSLDMATATDVFSDLESWAQDHLFPELCRLYHLAETTEVDALVQGLTATASDPPRVKMRQQDFIPAVVTAQRQLSSTEADDTVPVKHHVDLQIVSTQEQAQLDYAPGDHVLVLPRNEPSLVNRVLVLFKLSCDTVLTITSGRRLNIPDGTQLTASDLFGAYVELGQPITSHHIATLIGQTHDEETKAQLQMLVSQQDSRWPDEKPPLLLEVLQSLPRLPIQLSTFLRMLPPMRLRTYSVSSALNVASNKSSTALSLTLSVVPGGVASTYLSTTSPGHMIYLRMQPNPGFRLPSDSSRPVIMICVGSGLAPFRGMIQQRMMMAENKEKMHLFYGCRGPELDAMYTEELDEAESKGMVVVRRAYSRQQKRGTEKHGRYVTDLLVDELAHLVELWNKDGLVRVCAGKEVADSVWSVLGPAFLGCYEVKSLDLGVWRLMLGLNSGDTTLQGRYVEEIFN